MGGRGQVELEGFTGEASGTPFEISRTCCRRIIKAQGVAKKITSD